MARFFPPIALPLACLLAVAAYAQQPGDAIQKRNDAYGNELEMYFRDFLVDQYPARAAKAWNRSYANVGAFLKSVEPNRARYRRIFAPPELRPTGTLQR